MNIGNHDEYVQQADKIEALEAEVERLREATLSNVSVNGHRLTWRELVEHLREQMAALHEKAALWDDLDRCEHGRHKGDACTLTEGCGGPSHGNPIARADGQIGYRLSGVPIVHPFLVAQPTEGQEREP